jgi:DNA-binding transcriptional ArsR family regulator
MVAIHQSGVSRHLRILHAAGFVALRPEGPKRLYSLRYRDLWESRLDRFAAQLDRRDAAAASERKGVTR